MPVDVERAYDRGIDAECFAIAKRGMFANKLAHRVNPAAVGYRSVGRGPEFGNPNLENYSPVELQHLDDFHVGVLIMHRTDFDGKRRVLRAFLQGVHFYQQRTLG